MCDYSLQHVKSRKAVVGDKLVTHDFGTGTRGFMQDGGQYDAGGPTAVCVLPGTELAFDDEIKVTFEEIKPDQKTAIFRQLNKEHLLMHHDALELPDGKQVMLTYLASNQRATVLQLPAAPKTEAEAKEQERLEVVA